MKSILTLTVGLALVAGCSSVQVDSDFDRKANFVSLSTYQWLAPSKTNDPELDNGLLRGRIESSVDATMAEKGYRRVESGPVDFFVASHVGIKNKIDVQTIPVGFGYMGWGMGVGAVQTDVDQYEEGTLMIDIVDRTGEKLMWRGTGRTRVSEYSQSPEERDREVAKVVNAILAKFPPEK